MSEKNWDIKDGKVEFKKRPIKDILEEAKTIDPTRVGNEVLTWVISNVENFIDNTTKMFKLDLILENVKGMPETTKLQDLYRAIPDDDTMTEKELDKATKCRKILDEITLEAHEHIRSSKDALDMLFKRMVFYYEQIIISPDNRRKALAIDEELKKLIRYKDEVGEEQKKVVQTQITAKIKEGEELVKFTELDGAVDINNFSYEAFSVGVKIKANKKTVEEEIEGITQEKEVVNEYLIPESFTVWLEINYKIKQRPTSMF